MTRFYRFLLFIFLSFSFISCSDKKDDIHWDRDMCERCKMVVSDRKNTVKMELLHFSKYLVFDDIGCFILWEKDNTHVEAKSVLINDSKTGKWIDMKKALYTSGNITPMDYGFWAYEKGTEPKDKKVFSYDEVKKLIIKKGK